MLKFKSLFFLRAYIFITFSILGTNSFADGYLTTADLSKVDYQCYLEESKIVFCSEQNISQPQVIIKIPLFEPVILSNGIRAYRLMATIENHTKNNLVGAKIRVTFDEKETQSINILISEKIIYKGTSTTRRSHLIRSDVPQNSSLYETLDYIYFNADTTNIKIRLKEILFEKN